MKVIEIFKSIQGEGAYTGKMVSFVRLAGCNQRCSFCDTDWENGVTEMEIDDIYAEIKTHNTNTIVWTGGEPLLQLKTSHLRKGYQHHIETNGSLPMIQGINYVSCSPKVGVDILKKNFFMVDEFRYPVDKNSSLPKINDLPPASNYYLSPIFIDDKPCQENLELCLKKIEEDTRWKLSIQIHKLLNIK